MKKRVLWNTSLTKCALSYVVVDHGKIMKREKQGYSPNYSQGLHWEERLVNR